MRSDRAAIAAALVRIKVADGSGSGVAVQTPSGLRILTCEHVVRGHPGCTVIMRTEADDEFVFTEVPATVERVNKKWDLAIVKIDDDSLIEVRPLIIAKDEPDLYEPVMLGSCPNNLFGVVLDGILQGRSGSLGSEEKSGEYLFSGLSVSGSSGGAVTNLDAELIGIITAVSRDEEQHVHPLGYAVPLRALRRFTLQKPRPALAIVRSTVEFTPDFDLSQPTDEA
jgi:S1-C subfamily serine protease